MGETQHSLSVIDGVEISDVARTMQKISSFQQGGSCFTLSSRGCLCRPAALR